MMVGVKRIILCLFCTVFYAVEISRILYAGDVVNQECFHLLPALQCLR